MFRAMYDFTSREATALSFQCSDQFTVMDTSDPYWWLVQNGYGQIGYVPASYLQQVEGADAEVLKSVDRAVEAIHFQATCAGGIYTAQHRSNLQKLLQHRRQIIETQSRRKDELGQDGKPKASCVEVTQTYVNVHRQTCVAAVERPAASTDDKITRIGSQKSRRAPPPIPPRITSTVTANKAASPSSKGSTSANNSPTSPRKNSLEGISAECSAADSPPLPADQRTSPDRVRRSTPAEYGQVPSAPGSDSPGRQAGEPSVETGRVSEELALDLVELVRRNTDLSYDKSRVAVGTVLSQLRESIPSIEPIMDDLLKGLIQIKRDTSNLESSKDAMRLEVIFSEMAACKDDSQQRSWALHEDESVITEYLTELISILNNANPEVCRQVVARDGYDVVDTLVLYYQMETRVSILLLLLQVFGALCGLEVRIISELLNSVLPLELARDLQSDLQGSNIQKMSYSILVLTMMFSRAEAIPIQHYTHLSKSFIHFLLESIEHPPTADEHDQIPDLLINLTLAFNLHFELPEDNLVMNVLAKSGTAKTFTEKLMLLVNRGVDPVRMFDHEPQAPDSVLKFLCDLFSNRSTAGLLYTNDARVLIDIVLRQLSDLSPGDKVRTEYLSLAQLIIKNSNYKEHQHRRSELHHCFNRIGTEDDVESQMDRLIVYEIWKEFCHMFPRPTR